MANKVSIKVLCAGDVNGNFQQLIQRVVAVNKKAGPFELLFCVGEFFGPKDEENRRVLEGDVQFPIPTYILGPCCPSTSAYFPDESAEFSATLTYLGSKGILTTANGLTVGYFSGIEAPSTAPANKFQFDEASVDGLLVPLSANSGFLGVDLLLTSIWPDQVWKHSSNQPSDQPTGSKMVSRLAAGLKPRYHFAGLATHYERSPYRNHRVLLEPAQHVTRFIGLAAVGNTAKQKWLYAFTITPMRRLAKAELVTQPDNCSEFPYMEVLEEFLARRMKEEADRAEAMGGGNGQFFYDMAADPGEEDNVDRGGRRKRPGGDGWSGGEKRGRREQNIQPDTCWFCLSNVGAEKHLVLSVGTACYTAMPKGPLTPENLLVMSIGHIQSLVVAPVEVRDEVIRFRDAYSLFCDKSDKVLCLFERNYKTSHLQVQFVPVPKSCAKALRSCFLNAARLKNIEFIFLKEGEQIWDLVNEGVPYFYLELPDGTRMFTRSMAQFPIQFGREVLAGKALLDCEDKVDWRNCVLGKEKEVELIGKLKAAFKPFDFTNEDSDEDDI